jgi:hypothetical protein
MQGRNTRVGALRRVLFFAAALLGLLLVASASASAKMTQTITFTSSPPSLTLAGGTYQVSATSPAGTKVLLNPGGACRFRAPSSTTSLAEEEKRGSPLRLGVN